MRLGDNEVPEVTLLDLHHHYTQEQKWLNRKATYSQHWASLEEALLVAM